MPAGRASDVGSSAIGPNVHRRYCAPANAHAFLTCLDPANPLRFFNHHEIDAAAGVLASERVSPDRYGLPHGPTAGKDVD
jgi:hypothetical protein